MADLKLTVGMAVYKDFANLWSTVTALRMYHPEILELLDIVVVDNAPETPDGERTKDFIENWTANTPGLGKARYIPFGEFNSTAAPRNHVFEVAESPNVLVMDSHVMIEPEAVRRLIDFYDGNPNTLDFYHGPLIYDDLRHASTHFKDEWRGEMWGTWGTDERYQYERRIELERTPDGQVAMKVHRTECDPFEIPGQGLGLFTCRKEAWLGFNPNFRGFGGEEMYIHTKYRQAGRKVWLLPWLRWAHQFGRPGGVPYPLSVEDKFRNYLIGLDEIGMSLVPAVEHFEEKLGGVKVDQMLSEVLGRTRDQLDVGSDLEELMRQTQASQGGQPMTPEQIAGQHITGEITPDQIAGGNLPPGMLQGQPGIPPGQMNQQGQPIMPGDPGEGMARDEMMNRMMQQIQMMSADRDRLSEERDKAMGMLSKAQATATERQNRRTAP
jgi:hypothetical protein